MKHADLGKVWKEYPAKIHYWLLQLTEEYDLTFKLSDEKTNLVPCLLPEKKPEVFRNDITIGCIFASKKKPEVFRNVIAFKLFDEKSNLFPYLLTKKKAGEFRNDLNF